jgi:hypothetical protein
MVIYKFYYMALHSLHLTFLFFPEGVFFSHRKCNVLDYWP